MGSSGIFYPSVSEDDGFVNGNLQHFDADYRLLLGRISEYYYYIWMRFVSVTIPPGATITNAFIRFTAYQDDSTTPVNTDIYFHDDADADAPTTHAGFLAEDLTSGIAWDGLPSWTNGNTYDTGDISSILQDVIDLGGWLSGNAVVVQIRNDMSGDAQRTPSSIDYESGAEKAELHVFWAGIVSFSASIGAASSTSGIQLKGGFIDAPLADQVGLDDSIAASGGSQTVDISDGAGLDDSIIGQAPIDSPLTDGAGLDDAIAAGGTFNTIQTDIAGLADWINGGLETNHALIDGAGLDDSAEALNWSEFLRENQFNYVIRYFCTLTGAANDTSDIEIPIQQFQARKRDGESTYLSVNIPSFDYAGQIADRANGQIIIEMAYFVNNIEQLREEILRVDLENIRTDQGSTNRSITLTGHLAESYGNQIATLTDPIYKYVSGGIRRFRFAIPDPYVNPGDTIRVGEDEFRAGFITYTVSSRYRSMEITEVG